MSLLIIMVFRGRFLVSGVSLKKSILPLPCSVVTAYHQQGAPNLRGPTPRHGLSVFCLRNVHFTVSLDAQGFMQPFSTARSVRDPSSSNPEVFRRPGAACERHRFQHGPHPGPTAAQAASHGCECP